MDVDVPGTCGAYEPGADAGSAESRDRTDPSCSDSGTPDCRTSADRSAVDVDCLQRLAAAMSRRRRDPRHVPLPTDRHRTRRTSQWPPWSLRPRSQMRKNVPEKK